MSRLKKLIESKNFLIAVCVCILTVTTMGISYSAFFKVKTNTVNQTITTGNLAVTYTSSNPSLLKDDIQPITDDEGMNQTENRVVYIQNTGSLDSKYILNIGYDMENFTSRSDYQSTDKLTPLECIRFALYEYNQSDNSSKLITGPLSISDLPIYKVNDSDYRYNRYSVIFDTVGNNTSDDATKTYQIKIWLGENATSEVSNTYFYINTEVEATVVGDTMEYNINGILKDDNNNVISNAKIDLHNGSLVVETDESGKFSLKSVPVGIYNINISKDDNNYIANLEIKEDANNSIDNLGKTCQASNESIFKIANKYNTTVNKIINKNNLDDFSENIKLNGNYKLYPSYIIKANYTKDINLTITVSNDEISSMTIK